MHQRRHLRISFDARSQKSADVPRADDKVAHFHQRFAAEDRTRARRREQVGTLIDELAYRDRSGVRSQLDHLGRRAKPAPHFLDFHRRAQLCRRRAPRLRGAQLHDEVNHLVEFECFQIAFAHR